MTKADLLNFLEPFHDDIQILVKEDMGLLDAARPEYCMATEEDRLNSGGLVTEGDGFVAI